MLTRKFFLSLSSLSLSFLSASRLVSLSCLTMYHSVFACKLLIPIHLYMLCRGLGSNFDSEVFFMLLFFASPDHFYSLLQCPVRGMSNETGELSSIFTSQSLSLFWLQLCNRYPWYTKKINKKWSTHNMWTGRAKVMQSRWKASSVHRRGWCKFSAREVEAGDNELTNSNKWGRWRSRARKTYPILHRANFERCFHVFFSLSRAQDATGWVNKNVEWMNGKNCNYSGELFARSRWRRDERSCARAKLGIEKKHDTETLVSTDEKLFFHQRNRSELRTRLFFFLLGFGKRDG